MNKSRFTNRDIAAIENERIFQQGVQVGMSNTVEFMYYMTAYTIQYKLGLNNDELRQVMRDILFNIDSFRTDHLVRGDYGDIKRQLNEKGIRIKAK